MITRSPTSAPAERPPEAGVAAPRAEFVEFYLTAYPPLCTLLCAMLSDHARVYRALAEAFADCWSQWPLVRTHPDLGGWLRRAAVVGYRSPEHRARAVARLGSAPDHPPMQKRPLFDALAQLPEVQRTTLVLHHMAGLTASDIAAEHGTSAETVRLRLLHGHLALTRRLEPASVADADLVADAATVAGADPVADAWEDARQAIPLQPAAPSVTSVFRLATRRRRTVWVAGVGVMVTWLLGTQSAISQSTDHPAVPLPTMTQRTSSESARPLEPPTSTARPGSPASGPVQRAVPRKTPTSGNKARGRVSRSIPRSVHRPLWGPQPGFPRPGWGFVHFF